MPFKSEKQRRFMWVNHPDIARKWMKEEHKVRGKMAMNPVAAMAAKRKKKKDEDEKESEKSPRTYSDAVYRRLQNMKPSSYSK